MGRDSWHGLRGVDCGLNDIRRRGQGAELSPAMRPKKRVVEAPTPAQPVEAEVQAAPAAPEAPAVPAVEVAAPLLTPPPTAVFSPLLPDDDDGSVEQALDDVADAEVVESQEEEPRPAPRRYGLRYLPGRPPR